MAWRWFQVSLLAAVIAGALLVLHIKQRNESIDRGSGLFNGELALTGRITGQTESLPDLEARCVSCHGSDRPLDRQSLTRLHSRRGEPASKFNRITFCALVRSGVDPGNAVITQSMPRYELTDGDCTAIWNYLQSH